jgi:hypothetical protein
MPSPSRSNSPVRSRRYFIFQSPDPVPNRTTRERPAQQDPSSPEMLRTSRLKEKTAPAPDPARASGQLKEPKITKLPPSRKRYATQVLAQSLDPNPLQKSTSSTAPKDQSRRQNARDQAIQVEANRHKFSKK